MASRLSITVGESLAILADSLVEKLSGSPGLPLDPEWIIVPSTATREWFDWLVAERLGASDFGRGDGICSNFEYLFPEEFVRRVETSALSAIGTTRQNFDIDVLTLRFMGTLNGPSRQTRARRLAEQVDELVRWRADLVESPDRLSESAADVIGALGALEPGPLAQRRHVREALRGSESIDLPARVSLFGLASVPGGSTFVSLVEDLASRIEIDAYVCVPSVERARLVVDNAPVGTGPLEEWHAESDEALQLWRDASSALWDYRESRHAGASSSLGSLQHHVVGSLPSAHDDDTVHFIDCAGASRQCEVARDAIFEAIDRDGLELRDILVVVTDLETFTPLFERHWSAPRLPFDLLESQVPLDSRLAFSFQLLRALGNYATPEQVMALVGFPCVSDQLELSSSERRRIWELIEESPVTFATSRLDRERLGFHSSSVVSPSGSWENLIDRSALATLYPAASAEPIGAIGRVDDLDAIGKLEQLLRVLDQESAVRSGAPRPLTVWIDDLVDWVTTLSGTGESDVSFERAVAKARRTARNELVIEPDLDFEEFSSWWRSSQASHAVQRSLSGAAVAIATPASLRYAPYRMVCLLGIDEELLPSTSLRSGAMRDRRAGDPDPRRSMNGALLSAVMSASDRLLVTFNGRDEESGRRLEPSIALSQLLAAHRLSSDPRYVPERSSRHGFAVAEGDRSVSYDQRFRELALRAVPSALPGDAVRARVDEIPVLPEADLDALVVRARLTAPSRHLLNRVLGAATPFNLSERSEVVPIDVDQLTLSRLRRRYLVELAGNLRVHFENSEKIPDFVITGHEPSVACASESCAWLCLPAHAVRELLAESEPSIAVIPERLWRPRMDYSRLTLAAYNLAADLTGTSSVEVSSVLSNPSLKLLDGRRLMTAHHTTQLARDLVIDDVRGEVWSLVRMNSTDSVSIERELISDCFDLFVLSALVPDSNFELVRYAVPKDTKPYARKNGYGAIPNGRFKLNPRTTLRLSHDHDPRESLSEMCALAERATSETWPLFRRTSVALAFEDRLTLGAVESSWFSAHSGFGESREIATRLLFPVSAEEVIELPGQRDVIEALRSALAGVEIQQCQPHTRNAPAALLSRGSDASAWRELEGAAAVPEFVRLRRVP